jgi:copper transport protein
MVALGAILELALQVPYVAGSLAAVTGQDVRDVLSSQFGAAHLVRLGVLGAALVLLRAVGRGSDSGTDRVLLAVAGAVGVATWSISGHPSATSVPTVSVAADMVHVASMSVWLGGLVMLFVFLLRRANADELGAIVPIWSRWAGYAVGALLLTGVAQALLQVGTVDALFTTTYGVLLLAKIGLVAVVLMVAWFSRRTVAAFVPDEPYGETPAESDPQTPAASDRAPSDESDGEPSHEDASGPPAPRQPPPTRRLRRLVMIEAAVAVVVIGLTSVLVQFTPAKTVADTTTGVPGVQTVTLTDPGGQFVLTADLTPAKVGINEVHLYAADKSGRPISVVEWTVTASDAAAGIDKLGAVVGKITDDHAIGQITFPQAGTWRMTFTLRLNEITNGIVFADFNVRSR